MQDPSHLIGLQSALLIIYYQQMFQSTLFIFAILRKKCNTLRYSESICKKVNLHRQLVYSTN